MESRIIVHNFYASHYRKLVSLFVFGLHFLQGELIAYTADIPNIIMKHKKRYLSYKYKNHTRNGQLYTRK